MIIGIVGFLGSGKGTVGEILSTEYGYKSFSFASPLKDAVASVFGWPRHLLEGDTKESREFRETVDLFWTKKLGKPNFTPRLALQLMGTEAGRDVFGADLWTASLEKRISGTPKVVVTDVRFRNEMKVITNMGGKIWRVMRGPEPDWYYEVAEYRVRQRTASDYVILPNENEFHAHMDKLGIHSSEWDWIGCLPNDHDTIDNNGTLDELKEKIAEALNETL